MKNYKYFALLFVSILMLNCGEKKEKKEGFEVKRTNEVQETSKDANAIALSGNDLMTFDKKELRVKAGEKVTLTFRHIGKMDKMVMGHNFVLLKQGTDVASFASKAAVARDTEYIPEGDAVIAFTKLLGGGESTSISFDAPAKGTYDYICSFPGHYGIMKGKFIVE